MTNEDSDEDAGTANRIILEQMWVEILQKSLKNLSPD